MKNILTITSLLALSLLTHAAQPEYQQDITKWQEVARPPDSQHGDRAVWSFAANYCDYEWHVKSVDGKPRADLSATFSSEHKEQPSFTAEVGRFRGATATAAVDDGWLIAFNQGEFGAALYWFSHDGKTNYLISDDQVVEFFHLADGLYAIEGLAHMSISRGSVIQIAKQTNGMPWRASSVVALPSAPRAISIRKDGTMLLALSEALVSIGADRKVLTLISDAPWTSLYPNSSILSPDERTLYIGMRQFVCVIDLTTNTIRYFVPSLDFLNRLPKDEEQRIRKMFGG